MTSKEIRQSFLEFYRQKEHRIVPSAPMVVRNDPTLMFTNAGMNQFKDFFLGTSEPEFRRVADTQKCLRVTGKHNDLEEVGHDTYHHTMFEMLGNWSFGDYFKKEAIDWAWEFLTDVMKIEPDRLYATIFKGDETDGIEKDEEAATLWSKYLPEHHILEGSKKDNFWEMGNTGPCGPCSEIHIDLRDNEVRKKTSGESLVNQGDPLVVEIWNLVFIQYNRKSDDSLVPLPEKHVDTGMGFERLCMAIQGKTSNYDTDLFTPLLAEIASLSGGRYGQDPKKDIAMRVIADHLRAISFSIADGQLPSNNKAGYVIRRILRRAIRYGYTFLQQEEPFIHKIVPVLTGIMGGTFEELRAQEQLIRRVILEEEQSFLNTLANGIRRLTQVMEQSPGNSRSLGGAFAFELYDTYGFPLDLTELIAREHGMTIEREGFNHEMEKQKRRSKHAAALDKEDWVVLREENNQEFTGYDTLSSEVKIIRYRTVKTKGETLYHLVFDYTPFYAESGGQVGDQGVIENEREKIPILDTQKENELIIHVSNKLPSDPSATFVARVDFSDRSRTASNHTATHLAHYALRKVLGSHVEQKGSLVNPEGFRFDFTHFQKMSDKEIREVEKTVNALIRQNIPLEEKRQVPMTEAREMGAVALFGEKYGEEVRVIRFGDSVELCGGIHARATGQLGFFKIIRESSIAAGIRRIEAITGEAAENYIFGELDRISVIKNLLDAKTDPEEAIGKLLKEHEVLRKKAEEARKSSIKDAIGKLEKEAESLGEIRFVSGVLEGATAEMLRDAAYTLRNRIENMVLVLGSVTGDKPLLVIMISDNLVKDKELNASSMIREIAKEIRGGGGGQPFFATAGGKEPAGIERALEKAREMIANG